MLDLRNPITERLDEATMNKIAAAPKPTAIAELIAVAKNFPNLLLGLDEVAEILNIAQPGRDRKAKATDFEIAELKKHPNIRVVQTGDQIFVRFVPGL